MMSCLDFFFFFFFNDTATTEIYTLSLHDALPISHDEVVAAPAMVGADAVGSQRAAEVRRGEGRDRSEEHTSELQSPDHLVCRLLLEKKKKHKGRIKLVSQDHEPTNRIGMSTKVQM